MRCLLGLSLLAACAGNNHPQQLPHQTATQSWAGYMESAENHEQEALVQEAAAAETIERSLSLDSYGCGDPILHEQSRSGTEPVDFSYVPCWNLEEESAIRHHDAANAERRAARSDRTRAHNMRRAEQAYCRGIPEHELDHSPFAHKRSIREVVAHRDGGEVRGVRIVFKPTPGLTAEYLRAQIACNQARFAMLGNAPTFMPDDPTLVAGAKVEVTQTASHIVVTVKVKDDVQAAVSLARAEDLVRPATQTATR